MHCASCELLLEKELKKIEDIKKMHVSHKKGTATIYHSGDEPTQGINDAIEGCGYEVSAGLKLEKKEERTSEDLWSTLAIALIVGIVAFILSKIEISRFFPDLGSDVNIFIALILGVVASLSTCLALTGGIVMSFANVYKVHEDAKHPFLSRAMPHLYFHAGRIGGFMILGGLLGMIGSKINYSITFTGYITILIAVVMFYIGLQILNFVPNITKLGFHLPKKLSRKIHDLENNDHHLTPILVGALTFFLPCGFTQSMQLAAVASQSFFSGALVMGAFAIGTMPVLLSIGIGSTYAQDREFKLFKKIIGVVIVFFAVYSLNSGLILANTGFSVTSLLPGGESQSAMVEEGVQVVKMDVDWSFKPNQFKIKKRIPVRWEINGVNISGCANEIIIPDLRISKQIQPGLNIVEFTPEKEGKLRFSCWMGMIGGEFIVTN